MINQLKTFIYLAGLTALLLLIGSAFGKAGLIFALCFSLIMNIGSFWFSDKIVLAIYKARLIKRDEYPELFEIVENLSKNAGIHMPRLYIIPVESPNAFATGRNDKNAAIAVTQGLLNTLTLREIKGVLAHEVAHIKNHDILIQSIAAVIAGAISSLANMATFLLLFAGSNNDRERGVNPFVFLITLIVAPIAAMLIQFAISRSREYLADEVGAKISKDPLALRDALEKLEVYSKRVPLKTEPATAHMFIVNPLKGETIATLFSTHPPIQKRIERLEIISRELR